MLMMDSKSIVVVTLNSLILLYVENHNEMGKNNSNELKYIHNTMSILKDLIKTYPINSYKAVRHHFSHDYRILVM